MRFGFQACPAPSVTAVRTYTGLLARNRACAIKSWTKCGRISALTLNSCSVASVLSCACRPARVILLNHELSAREFRKTAAFRDQFIKSSAFDHASAVEQQDARGIANGRKPVGDHETGTSLHHFVECGIDLGLGHGIERAGRLVEDQDRRILEQRACDRQPLPLAAGQHPAALADIAVEFQIAAFDEFERLGARPPRSAFPVRSRRACRPADCRRSSG